MSERRSFREGERVACYMPGLRRVGIVSGIGIGEYQGQIQVRFRTGMIDWFHPKQCRRLRKRAGRRVWINPKVIPQALGAATVSSGSMRLTSRGPVKGWIEFREVRKRKESP